MNALYASPLEGITGFVWRTAHDAIFGGADKYFAPFFSPDQNLTLHAKTLRDLTAGEKRLVPQILTNRSDYFIRASHDLASLGYSEINLNLGCPSGTVVAKHKGSGLLRDTAFLTSFLDDIFTSLPELRLSVKTRVGISDKREWETLLPIFESFPVSELIIHPRLQKEQYTGSADRELFLRAAKFTCLPLVYNGDVSCPDDGAFSYGCAVMVGRGLVSDPALFRRQKGGKSASREELCAFHERLLAGYFGYMQGEKPVICRMRETWRYLSSAFSDTEKPMKRMAKAKTLSEYTDSANAILRSCPLKSEE